MKQKILAALALALPAMLAQAQPAAAGTAPQPVVLKVAHFMPPAATAHKVMTQWCAHIGAQSENRLQCQIYPAMQLGGTPAQLMQQAIDGVADVVWTLPGFTAGRFAAMEVFELPFMARDAQGASRAAWQFYEKHAHKDFADIKPLAFNVHDRGHIHNNKRPITKVADLRGLKMRAPTRLTNRIVAALGATPVAMPISGVADAVSKGVIDGYVLPWEVTTSTKLHELTRYHSEIGTPLPGLYTTVIVVGMNKAKYASLPAELRKVIDANSGEAFSAAIGRMWDEAGRAAREQAAQRGSAMNAMNTINTVDSAAAAEFLKVGEHVAADWVQEVTAKGYPGQQLLDSARTLIKQHSLAAD